MALEQILKQPMNEPELFKRLLEFVRAQYHDLRSKPGYFLKFERVGEGVSQFSYALSFNNNEEHEEFKWSSEYNLCGITIFNEVDHYYFVGFGFFCSFRAKVFIDRIDMAPANYYENPNYNYENIKRPSRELVEAARREFGMLVNIAKTKKGAA